MSSDDEFEGVVPAAPTSAGSAARLLEGSMLQEKVITPAKEFVQDSKRFVTGCEKPSSAEYSQVLRATGVGFLLMGAVAFVIKIVHIPITQILVGSG